MNNNRPQLTIIPKMIEQPQTNKQHINQYSSVAQPESLYLSKSSPADLGQSSQNFKYSFLLISLFGLICCLDRSDYNTAVGIFGYMLWSDSHFPQKHRILWVVFFSILGDLMWVIGVSVLQWGQEDTVILNRNLRTLTQIVSIINMVYKLGILIFAVCSYDACKDLLKPSSFKKKVLYL